MGLPVAFKIVTVYPFFPVRRWFSIPINFVRLCAHTQDSLTHSALNNVSSRTLLKIVRMPAPLRLWVEKLPEFLHFQVALARIQQEEHDQFPNSTAEMPQLWPDHRLEFLFDIVREGNAAIDWHTFVWLEQCPQARGYIGTIDIRRNARLTDPQ